MFESLRFLFVQNALITGSCVAIISALIGYFLVGRSLTFAGHALPNIGFAGATGAVLLGINPLYGLFAFTITAAIGIGLLGKNVRERDTAISILMTLMLGLGLLFMAIYSGYAQRTYSLLFGTILGISQYDALVTAIGSILSILIVLALFRPLLFSTFDPGVAEARGIPVRGLSVVFLILTAITVTMSIQVVGALLVFTLLVGPAATAMRITPRPFLAIGLAMLLGLGYIWLGIPLATENIHSWLGWLLPEAQGYWPVSFFIASLSFLVYLPVRLFSPLWIGRGRKKQQNSSHVFTVQEAPATILQKEHSLR